MSELLVGHRQKSVRHVRAYFAMTALMAYCCTLYLAVASVVKPRVLTDRRILPQSTRRAPVKFNQMSSEEVKMSGEGQKNFVYTASTKWLITYSVA